MPDPTRTASTPLTDGTATADGTVTRSGSGTTAGTSTATPPSGSFAPPGYELDAQIGQGGMGAVFRATDLELSREVAVKILLPRYAPCSVTAKRFVDEARITGQLQHPGVPAVYRVGHLADGRPFLAMKLIRGQTLDALLRAEGAGAGRWAGVFEGVCQAVGYAHAHGVIHRDLKPGNVMVGAFGEIQVMDWGLAKVLDGPRAGTGAGDPPDPGTLPDTEIHSLRDADLLTQAGSVMGTPAYMAPEQAIGAVDQIDRRTDVFGLGAILCSLITGQPPYVGDSAESTRQLAARAKLDDAFARLDGCDAEPDLIALSKRCLSAEKADRPADGQEVARAVADLRAAADERARRAELDRVKAEGEKAAAEVRAAEQRKRRRVVQWAGGVTAGVLLAGVIGTTVGLVRAETQRDKAVAAEKRASDQLAETEAAKKLAEENGGRAAEQAALARENEANALKQTRFALDGINKMVFDFQGELAYQPGGLPLRKKLLLSARATLADIHEAARKTGYPDTPLVISHLQMGKVELEMGNAAAARREFDTGTRVAERLAAEAPAAVTAQRNLMLILLEAGQAEIKLGRPAEAAAAFERAREVNRQLLARHPTDIGAQVETADVCAALAEAARAAGRPDESLRYYRERAAVYERLAAEESAGHRYYRTQHARSCVSVVAALADLNRGDDAVREADTAVTLYEQMAAESPVDPVPPNAIYNCLLSLGTPLDKCGRAADHVRLLRRSLAVQERAAGVQPKNTGLASSMADTCLALGDLLQRTPEGVPEAVTLYDKLVRFRTAIAVANPTTGRAQQALVFAHLRLAELLQTVDRTSQAVAALRQAVGVCVRQVGANPNNRDAERQLGECHGALAIALVRAGDVPAATEAYQAKLAAYRRVLRFNPDDLSDGASLADSHLQLARLLGQTGRHADALAHLHKYVHFMEGQVEAAARRPDAEANLAAALDARGRTLERLGRWDEAFADHQASVLIRKRLAAAAPADFHAQVGLAASYTRLGVVEKARRKFADASRWYTEALTVFRTLDPKKLTEFRVDPTVGIARHDRAVCGSAERAISDIDFLFRQSDDLVPDLADVRVKALLAANKPADAVATAGRFAAWDAGRGHFTHTAAKLYAACAAAVEKDRDPLTEKVVELLRTELKLLKTPARLTELKRDDPAFDGVRAHPAFVAVLREVEGLPETLPPPRRVAEK